MALTTWTAFQTAHPEKSQQVAQNLMCVKGVGANEIYVLEADSSTGGLAVVTNPPAAATFPAESYVAFGTVAASYTTILTASSNVKVLLMRSNLNQQARVSLDGGVTDHFTLDPYDAVGIDLSADGLYLASGAVIKLKYTGVAPTAGSFKLSVVY